MDGSAKIITFNLVLKMALARLNLWKNDLLCTSLGFGGGLGKPRTGLICSHMNRFIGIKAYIS